MRRNSTLYRMIIAAMLMAIGMVLPKLLGGIQVVGQAISPLHVISLIAGLTLGGFWGGLVGFACPMLGHFLFSAPPVISIALPMAFECLAYGVISGLLYGLLRRKMAEKPVLALLAAQIIAMLLGRVVGGAAKALLLAAGAIQTNAPFTFAAFISSYFVSTAAAAVLHLIIVPAVVIALEKARLSPMGQAS